MGIPGLVERLQAAVIHNLVDIIVKFFFGYQVVFPYGFADDFPYRQTGRQAGKRVLEDNLHFGTHGAQLFRSQVKHFLAVKQHLATGFVGIQAQDRTARGRFATAGFTDQPHGRTALEVKRNTVDGFYHPVFLAQTAFNGEVFLQVIDHQEILGVIRHRRKVIVGGCVLMQPFLLCIVCHYFSSFRS